MRIRAARTTDASRLIRLLSIQLREHGITLDARLLARGVRGLLRRPELGRFLVAGDGSDVVGFAALSFLWTLEHGGRAAWLDELYVVPEHRGRGIGRALLLASYRIAREAGAMALDLEIEKRHARAANLYRREGFKRLSRERWSRGLK
jgi:ribosomal protein S18 acetylase RimI-like enzyme